VYICTVSCFYISTVHSSDIGTNYAIGHLTRYKRAWLKQARDTIATSDPSQSVCIIDKLITTADLPQSVCIIDKLITTADPPQSVCIIDKLTRKAVHLRVYVS